MNKTRLNFAAAGFLFMAAVITGCLNPVSFNTPPAEEETEETLSGEAAPAGDRPVTIKLLLGDEAAPGATGSRSVAGPEYEGIASGPGVLNYAQVIIYDKDNTVISVEEQRYEGTDQTKSIEIRGLDFNDKYTFLVLIGHWQRDYTAETKYVENAPPTLLAVGYADQAEIESGKISIELRIIEVHTQFLEDGANDFKAPVITDGTPQIVSLSTNPFSVKWTINGTGFKHLFSAAKKTSPQTDDFNAVFPETKGFFRRDDYGEASVGPTPGSWNTLNMTPIPSTSEDVKGSVYFNLEYTAFTGLEGLSWNKEKPKAWIIRNGINDNPQNTGTTFKKEVAWEGTIPSTPNGNGAVRFRQGFLAINFPISPD